MGLCGMCTSEAKSNALYGSTINETTRTYFQRCQAFLITVCALGAICQIVQVGIKAAALEFVCAGVYLVYNVAGMLIIRVANVGFKHEDVPCLKIAARLAFAMALYGAIIFVTVPTFQNTVALTLMGIFGVVNVLVILPTNAYEDLLMLKARSNGVGLEKAKALTLCEHVVVNGFLVFANVFILCVVATCLAILATGGAKLKWQILRGFYLLMSVVPLVLPKVEHLVSTETRTWPLKVLVAHFALVVLAVILIGVVLGATKPTRSTRVFFGAVGVLNGVLVALALGITALRAIYNPRTAVVVMEKDGDIEAVEKYDKAGVEPTSPAVEVQG